jgi:RsmE family RNA methyltransferase
MSLTQLLQTYKDATIFVGASTGNAITTSIPILKTSSHIIFLVGPEADFSPHEYELLAQAGAHFISLGPTVLRAATACQLGVGMLRALFV